MFGVTDTNSIPKHTNHSIYTKQLFLTTDNRAVGKKVTHNMVNTVDKSKPQLKGPVRQIQGDQLAKIL